MPMYGQVEGAIVTAMDPNSPAYRNGLRPGDIIYGVNQRRVRTANELVVLLRQAQTPLRLSLLRGEYRVTLTIR